MAASKPPKKPAAKKPTARKPAAKKPATPGVFDVAKPGSASLSPGGSPPKIIIKHQVMQEPTVISGGDAAAPAESAEASTAPVLPKARKLVIQPLHDDIKSEPAVAPPATEATPAETEAEPAPPAPQSAEPQLRTSVILQPAAKPKSAAPPAEAEPAPPAAHPQPPKTETRPAPNTPIGELAPEPDTTAIPDDNAARQADAEVARARAARLQKMIDEEEYFLPIETLEERRSRKIALIGLLVIVVLAAAWYDSALDAGLLPNSFNLPHSHLFTGK